MRTLVGVPRDRCGLVLALFLATLVLDLSFRTRQAGEGATDGIDLQNGAKFAAWAAMLALGFFNRRRIAALVGRDSALLAMSAFASFALVSAAWSPVPSYSAACALANFGWASLAIVLALDVPDGAVLVASVAGLGLETAAGIVGGAVVPDLAWMQPSAGETAIRLQGFSGHANLLAQHAGLLLVVALAALDLKAIGRAAFVLVAAIAVIALLLSDSRTTIVAVAAAVLAVATRRSRHGATVLLVAACLAACWAWLKALDMLPDPSAFFGSISRSGSSSEISTLTGRTDLWAIAWRHFLERPFLGWGYNGTEKLMADSVEVNFPGDPVNAHNLPLQVLMTVGLVGALPVLAYSVILAKRFIVEPDGVRDRIFVFLMVLGFAEAENMTVPAQLSFLLFWAMARDARIAATCDVAYAPSSDLELGHAT